MSMRPPPTHAGRNSRACRAACSTATPISTTKNCRRRPNDGKACSRTRHGRPCAGHPRLSGNRTPSLREERSNPVRRCHLNYFVAALLAMTAPSLRAERSNPVRRCSPGLLRRCAPRNDGFFPSLRAQRSNPVRRCRPTFLRPALLAMTAPSLRAKQSHPVRQCHSLNSFVAPLLAMTASVIASTAKQSSTAVFIWIASSLRSSQ